MVCPVFGWVVFDIAGLSVICGWYGWFVADLWVWLVCGWFSLCLCACMCVCVGGGGGGSSEVLVSILAVLSYQNYIIFVSKQELF